MLDPIQGTQLVPRMFAPGVVYLTTDAMTSGSAAPFRATGITAYLNAGGTLANTQAMAAHESPRTTKLYDGTGDKITLDEIERITILLKGSAPLPMASSSSSTA